MGNDFNWSEFPTLSMPREGRDVGSDYSRLEFRLSALSQGIRNPNLISPNPSEKAFHGFNPVFQVREVKQGERNDSQREFFPSCLQELSTAWIFGKEREFPYDGMQVPKG